MSISDVTGRVAKVLYKAGWAALSVASAQPKIDELHRRESPKHVGLQEFVKRCHGPVYVESEWGYIISGDGHLIEESLVPQFPFWKEPWRVGLTSPIAFMQARHGKTRPVLRLKKAVSLRHLWEWNYYHFYIDVLGKLSLFDEAGVDPTTPILIGRYALQLPFVRQVLDQGALKQRTWVVQDNTYVVADEVYFCRNLQPFKQRVSYVLDLMHVPRELNPSQDRIFLTRSKQTTRHIINMDEVEPVLRKHEFRIVDTQTMSVQEQIDLFARTRYLLAIHGAGLTNMIFRREAPLSVLEMHAINYCTEDFMVMCHELGYKHDRLACRPDNASIPQHCNLYVDPGKRTRRSSEGLASIPQHCNLYVDPAELERKIIELLS